ncbi:hypothetical protein AM588_10002633 [Phytophthora nicotianae]|uniref:ABC transporter domain-containing protein n=1 Tax=Phytophthora nicotianae TaxID=4792 RepID=A0A0W8D1P7_PHYNI|nr:hypothetical protein AM588_10002633 [Phytophthora nicotianae]
MRTAFGCPLPGVEVRFENVSISASITVKDESQVQSELPTIANVIKRSSWQVGSKRHVIKKNILRNISGAFKRGTMTLILGQPGSGKSSLMQLLSGRFAAGRNVSVEGDVTFNGLSRESLMKRLPQLVAYVPQNDKHLPTLTVKETLEFAHACNGGGLSKRDQKNFVHGTHEENQAALAAARAMYEHLPDIVIRQLGLENCQDTVVGDAMLRGVSGGERKRVTTGEMAFGNKFVLMMDEISTGLDSAATFDIISTQRSLAKTFHKTIVISLLQPSPEVFELFDDVLLLNDGTASYNLTRFLISIMLGLVFGIAYVGAEYSSYQGINSGLGMVFMTQSYMTFIVFSSVVPISIQERASFYRERSAQTYNAFWYFIGATIVEIPYCFVESLLFMVIYYPMVGFTGWGQFLAYWVNLTGLVILQAYFGQLLAYLSPSLEVASVFVILVNYIWITFTGFNPPVASIPRGYRWLYHLTPHKYTFASLIAIVFGDCPSPGDGNQLGCQQMTGAPPTLGNEITISDYLDEIFSAKHNEIWSNFGIILLWIACLRVVSLLALRFVNHQKR